MNIDKGPIEEDIILKRLVQFQTKGLSLVLTAQPYFYKKALMFPNQHFVLGFDTFVRLLDVRYYDGSQARLHDILRQLDEVKTSFYVGGRLNNLTQRFEVLDEGALDIALLFYCTFRFQTHVHRYKRLQGRLVFY